MLRARATFLRATLAPFQRGQPSPHSDEARVGERLGETLGTRARRVKDRWSPGSAPKPVVGVRDSGALARRSLYRPRGRAVEGVPTASSVSARCDTETDPLGRDLTRRGQVPPEDIIVQAWQRELRSYVAEPMVRRIAEATVRALHDAGWELPPCSESDGSVWERATRP
jgi:hypothetical protein